MKEIEIKELLGKIAKEKGIGPWLTETEKAKLATKLLNLETVDRTSVRKIIESVSIYIKESVDFTDTNYLLDQIVDILKK